MVWNPEFQKDELRIRQLQPAHQFSFYIFIFQAKQKQLASYTFRRSISLCFKLQSAVLQSSISYASKELMVTCWPISGRHCPVWANCHKRNVKDSWIVPRASSTQIDVHFGEIGHKSCPFEVSLGNYLNIDVQLSTSNKCGEQRGSSIRILFTP